MFCAISGQVPTTGVYCSQDGFVYEKKLILKYLLENENIAKRKLDSVSPMTGERIDQNSQLFDIQATSPEIVKPKPPSFTSIPSLLISLQNEWDALMLETFTLKKQFHQTRKELSNSLYENDAAKRVIARLIKERDEARVQLSNFKGSAPVAAASATAASAHPVQDSNAMDTDAAPLPASVVEKIDVISEELSSARRKRKTPESLATPDQISQYKVENEIKNLNTAKEPSVSCLDLLETPASADQETTSILSAGLDGTVSFISIKETKMSLLASTKAHKKKVTSVNWVDSSTFVSCSLDGSVKVWALEEGGGGKTGYKIKGKASDSALSFDGLSPAGISSLSMHPGKSLFVTSGVDETSWKLNDLESVKTLDCVETESTVNLVQFHPDGLILATGSTNGQVKLWDIKSRSLATQFTGHSSTSSITSLAFSENGYHFASTCNQDSIVKFWDLRKLSEFYSLDVGKSGGVGGDFVGRVRFDHSGKYVAVASSNLLSVFTVKKWDLVAEFNQHTANVSDFLFGRNASFVVSAAHERKLCLLA